MSFENIINFFNATVLVKSFFWQIFTVAISYGFSVFLYRFNRKFVFSKIVPERIKKHLLSQIYNNYIHLFVFPLFAIISLAIGNSIYSLFMLENYIIIAAIEVVLLLAFLKFLRKLTGNDFAVNVIGILLVATLILDALNILMPTVTYLDGFAITIGDVRLSLYIIAKAFIVLAFVFWFTSLVSKKSKKFIEKKPNILPSTKTIITKFIDIGVYFFIFIITLKTFGVDLTALAVLGGAVGVGIGFGLQKIASNFISGIILLFEKSIETGDIVEIDGSIYGTIKRFSGRYTLIECFDGKEIMMPNEEFIVSRVVNWTYSNSRARIKLSIGVAYDSDLEKAKNIMLDCALKHPQTITNDPEIEPGCYLKEFGDSSVNFDLYFWVNDINEGLFAPKSDVYMSIWKEFKDNNIIIPFPQREVTILNPK